MRQAIPRGWAATSLGEVKVGRSQRAVPSAAPEQLFELWSVPSHEKGRPELLRGADIGSDKQYVVPGTVLVCKINPRINRVWVVGPRTGGEQIASTEWIPFPPVDGVVPGYLVYYLQQEAFRTHLATNVSGVGGSLMRVRPAVVDRFPLLLPPTREQHRIVAAIEEHLSRLDAAVAGLDRVKALLPRYRAAVLKAAVEGVLCGDGAKSGWKALPLEDIAVDEPGAVTDGPFGSKLKTSHYTDSGPRVIRLQNIGDGYFVNERAHISDSHFETLRRHEVREGDVVIAGLGEVLPRACIVPAGLGPAIVKADCFKFRPDPHLVRAAWLNIALNSEPVRRRASLLIKGVGRPRLSLGVTRILEVEVPPVDVQDQIIAEVDRALSVTAAAAASVEGQAEHAAALRQSILARAFRGELVPQDPNDEPAEVLLERIRAERAGVVPVKRAARKRKVVGRK